MSTGRLDSKSGPVPRMVRRCQVMLTLPGATKQVRCQARIGHGPEGSVIAACWDCAAMLTPRGTHAEMAAEYDRLISLYGWKAS